MRKLTKDIKFKMRDFKFRAWDKGDKQKTYASIYPSVSLCICCLLFLNI